MGEQDPQSINFLGMNIIIVGVFVLAAFAYLVIMIRKRWKRDFLHEADKKTK
jgi:hypothetical protein